MKIANTLKKCRAATMSDVIIGMIILFLFTGIVTAGFTRIYQNNLFIYTLKNPFCAVKRAKIFEILTFSCASGATPGGAASLSCWGGEFSTFSSACRFNRTHNRTHRIRLLGAELVSFKPPAVQFSKENTKNVERFFP